tara:strand:+ start:1271 stop:1720 length:450 start_codon:yes stop_codon:yes gene_type:complete
MVKYNKIDSNSCNNFYKLYMCNQSLLDNIINIFMFAFVITLTIYLTIRRNKIFKLSYIPLITFTIVQLTLCNLILPCSGTSLIWNAQSGYLLCRSILKDKNYNFPEKNIIISLIISFVIISNLMFIKKPLQTHIAHILAFIIGFVTGLI